MPEHVELWGWDGAAPWVPVLVDAAGHLQVDMVTAPSLDTHCRGYDGAVWRPLIVGAPADAYATPTYALEVMSFLMGYDGADWNRVRVDAAGHIQVDVLSSALPALAATAANQVTMITALQIIDDMQVKCYGWDGAAWQTLLVESDVLKNLRVRLYDGANGIDSDELDSVIVTSGDRGILTRSQVCGYNLEPFHQRRTDADALAAVARELCQMNIALLYGYNGATFDRLRTESAAAFNLRVKLYDGANGISTDTWTLYPAVAITALAVTARMVSWDGDTSTYLSPYLETIGDNKPIRRGLYTNSYLMGFDGTTWDRLRTYGTGILKVGRAEIDSTTLRKTVTGAVVGGSHNLYWISCSPDGPGSEFELTDAIAGGGAVVFDHFDPDRHSEVIHLDPPMKFTTGIWIEKFDHIKSLVFCYV